jgi:hypothetical protein
MRDNGASMEHDKAPEPRWIMEARLLERLPEIESNERREGFDKGEQKFEYQFKIGSVGTDMGWLMVSGNITGKKDGKDVAFPINISLTVAKNAGDWRIAAMHFWPSENIRVTRGKVALRVAVMK